MFFVLIVLILLSSTALAYLFFDQKSISYIGINKNYLIYSISAILLLATALICANRAALGLLFNPYAPDVNFIQTISYEYLGFVFLSNLLYIFIGIVVYYFLTRKLKISPVWLLIALFILSIIIYYPGTSSLDGDNSYRQYLSHSYENQQPPLFTLWWNIFQFYGATFLMNLLCYYGGIIYISYFLAINGKKWQNDLLVLFCFNPLLFTQLTIVWKDISYTGFLIDCVALYLATRSIKNKKVLACLWTLYFLFLFLAVGFRINGVFAVFPLAIFGIYNLSKTFLKQKFSLLVNIGISSILIIGYLTFNNFLIKNVFSASESYPQVEPMIGDMVYIECGSNYNYKIDLDLFSYQAPDTHDVLCNRVINYYNQDALSSSWNNTPVMFNGTVNEQKFLRIKSAWKYALLNYPGIYLEYRTKFFLNDLFFEYWYPSGDLTPAQHFLFSASMEQHKDMKFEITIFMLGATFACLFMCIYFRLYGLAFIILLSSLMQLFGWFFLIVAHPARYFLWNYLSAVFAIIFLSLDYKFISRTKNYRNKVHIKK